MPERSGEKQTLTADDVGQVDAADLVGGDKPTRESPSGAKLATTIETQTVDEVQANWKPTTDHVNRSYAEMAGELRLERHASLAGLLDTLWPIAQKLGQFLRGIDAGDFGGLLQLVIELQQIHESLPLDAAGWKARVTKLLQVAHAFAVMTPGDRDDQVIGWLSNVLGRDEVVTIVSQWLARMSGKFPVAQFHPDKLSDYAHGDEIEIVRKAAGLGIGQIAIIVRLIMELVAIIRNRRSAAVEAAS